MYRVWTEAEKRFIAENADRMKDGELAAVLTRLTGRVVTPRSLAQIRNSMGIKKARGRGACEVVERPPREQ